MRSRTVGMEEALRICNGCENGCTESSSRSGVEWNNVRVDDVWSDVNGERNAVPS